MCEPCKPLRLPTCLALVNKNDTCAPIPNARERMTLEIYISMCTADTPKSENDPGDLSCVLKEFDHRGSVTGYLLTRLKHE